MSMLYISRSHPSALDWRFGGSIYFNNNKKKERRKLTMKSKHTTKGTKVMSKKKYKKWLFPFSKTVCVWFGEHQMLHQNEFNISDDYERIIFIASFYLNLSSSVFRFQFWSPLDLCQLLFFFSVFFFFWTFTQRNLLNDGKFTRFENMSLEIRRERERELDKREKQLWEIIY